MPRKEEDSLGQDFTRIGDLESPKPSDSEQSLGDQSTFGDAGSSAFDVSGLDDALDSDKEVLRLLGEMARGELSSRSVLASCWTSSGRERGRS